MNHKHTPPPSSHSGGFRQFLFFSGSALIVAALLLAAASLVLPANEPVSAAIVQTSTPNPRQLTASAVKIAQAAPPDTATPAKNAPSLSDQVISSAPVSQPTAAAVEITQAPKTAGSLAALDWEALPVVPEMSATVRQIYLRGLALGNNPNAFSKVGDCNSLSARYLTYFSYEPVAYNLGNYTYLQPAINAFKTSFIRQSVAVGDGFNTSAVLSPFRADPAVCKAGESPLACEYRLNRPSFALIAIGTDDYLEPAKFEANLRTILKTTIDLGIVPILATKVDNANELNYNPIIAGLAEEYDIPLWNLWRAAQPLPNAGQSDNIHPFGEFAAFDFSADNLSKYGWPVRNLTALQALSATWDFVTNY